ncbi:tRNA (adenine(58)-N(1))-methyltransferase catalytic subunit trmt61a [Scheffersomyces spartinae]|uniref:tRNA (adenine(58)-N(1))-methyltransferase catalytic subunit TRM61 n=1 Tax=Scheffersomyces spartinae TaxID=45513 RepID=A0A9P7VCX4_9ASCO|nr:tRNA (adenine(58)-N(1))-methyltransferase catalytic subunit trmt61a [Scheffersomyces spartinae]KAG7195549.1 tRNA (adenine(58)-N(1))-methyltransferase catalytic subunit trmt61a [Scheffersomyces spartinae]
MLFYRYKDVIEEGDIVMVYIGRQQMKLVNVTLGEVINTRYGHFEHDKMVGKKYGDQMVGAKGYGFIYLLHPTPELWTVSLPHRTQIVYTPDSSYVIQRLNIGPGSRVIEAGTGSASFTHSFARTLGDQGKLFTYEFHEVRCNEARKELERHGLLAVNTTITHRDVCQDGFEIQGEDIRGDAVFLDLPAPWTAIPHLKHVISKEMATGICCFSPCIEQVDKTVAALQEEGWTDIEMVEVMGRRWEARKDMVRDISDVVKRLKDIQARKTQGIEGRRVVKLQSETATPEPNVSYDSGNKRPASTEEDQQKQSESESKEVSPSQQPPSKFQNLGKGFNPFGKGIRVREGDESYAWTQVTKIESDVKSHTSYLTFARNIPTKKQPEENV